ncbi:MAG TPA: hypothetical protein VLZ54_00470 [Arenibacter sp.]|nr:hypothetical protein [Arenibacter sp.]
MIECYRKFEDKGTRTHITTNLNLSQIGDRYGKQTSDRFVRMFNQLRLDGPSEGNSE